MLDVRHYIIATLASVEHDNEADLVLVVDLDLGNNLAIQHFYLCYYFM